MRVLFFILALLPAICFAEPDYRLTIVNHFDKALQFNININPQVLSDFSDTFTIESGNQASSKVEDIGKEAYLRVEDGADDKAFWGVEISNNKVYIHGYISKGVAYSWKESTVTFCTPDEYKKNHGCM